MENMYGTEPVPPTPTLLVMREMLTWKSSMGFTIKQLKTDDNIVILLADKGPVTVVMDKTDYNDRMDALVNDKQT